MNHALLPDKLYYDIVVSNLNSETNAPPVAYFNETRNLPYIYNPSAYYFSIVRFTLDTTSLPSFIPTIQENQGNRDLTIYKLTLDYKDPSTLVNFSHTETILFEPQDKFAPLPLPPNQTINGLQYNGGGYYLIFSFQYWVFLVNKALVLAFNALNALVIAGGSTLPVGSQPPVMTWDTTRDIAILNFSFPQYSSTTADPIRMYMNASLYQLFSSFPAYLDSLNVSQTNKLVEILTDDLGNGNLGFFPPVATPSTPQYASLAVYQEYSTIANMNPVASIVFTSNTLPIVANILSAPVVFIGGQPFPIGQNANIANIITDFVSETGQYKPSIVYNPTAQFRLAELLGNKPLTNLDIGIFWKDRLGELNPYRLYSGATVSVKILFTKKDIPY
jgi:hypothetical protein